MADNYRFDLTGVKLETAMEIAFENAPGRKAVAWAVLQNEDDTGKRLVLFWNKDPLATPLPSEMSVATAVEFVKDWLVAQNYGREPDHDGSNRKGCRIYNEAWGHVAKSHYAFVAIEPVWMMYGK